MFIAALCGGAAWTAEVNDLLLDGAGARSGIGVVSVTRSGMNGASLIAPPRHL